MASEPRLDVTAKKTRLPDIGDDIEFRVVKFTQLWRLGRVCSCEYLNNVLKTLTVLCEGRRYEVPFRKTFWHWPQSS